MHGAVADTSYFMREGFPLDAAFLTPIALLTSASAFVEGRKVVDGIELERLNRSAMAVYYPVLMRWAELSEFARTEAMDWPLEPTIEAAFEVFAAAYNATAEAYAGTHRVPPSFHEGAPGSLADVHSTLFIQPVSGVQLRRFHSQAPAERQRLWLVPCRRSAQPARLDQRGRVEGLD